jgi:cytidylate kinase
MTRNVVTFSVQLGSGGHEIARTVADDLRYRFIDREVILQAAEMSGVSLETIAAAERWPSFVERMVERLTASAAVTDGLLMAPGSEIGLTMRTSQDYRRLIEEVVRDVAADGRCVIVGHAGQAILGDRPDVFKVLVHGSSERRAQRLAWEAGIGVEAAREQVTKDDCARAKFFRCAYGMEWLNSGAYDLTINSDEVNANTAAAWVIEGVRAKGREPALA